MAPQQVDKPRMSITSRWLKPKSLIEFIDNRRVKVREIEVKTRRLWKPSHL
ncbi:hypothetical protein Fmac_001487 [Flemingia macrophylla]|uniref:Uncharacterized protein n=1 Tax=Flemingia macrophylla TaxID=520843 RepID=A0ABD1NH82_9FABA